MDLPDECLGQPTLLDWSHTDVALMDPELVDDAIEKMFECRGCMFPAVSRVPGC